MSETESTPALLLVAAATEAEALRAGWGALLPGVALVVAGVGRAGDAAAREAMANAPPRTLNVGLSGALAGSLPAGAICVVTRWVAAEGEFEADGAGAARIMAGLAAQGVDAVAAVAATVDAPLHEPDARRRLARAGAELVDMESGAWAALARAAGVPFAAIRVVSDHADNALPLPRHLLLRLDGSVRWGRWLRAMVGRAPTRWPAEWRALRRARRDWIAAMDSMRRVGAALAALLGPAQ